MKQDRLRTVSEEDHVAARVSVAEPLKQAAEATSRVAGGDDLVKRERRHPVLLRRVEGIVGMRSDGARTRAQVNASTNVPGAVRAAVYRRSGSDFPGRLAYPKRRNVDEELDIEDRAAERDKDKDDKPKPPKPPPPGPPKPPKPPDDRPVG